MSSKSETSSGSGSRDWHIDKRLNIGHLVVTLLACVSIIVTFTSLKTHVVTNSQAIEYNTERIARQEVQQKEDRQEILSMLRRIESHIYEKKN